MYYSPWYALLLLLLHGINYDLLLLLLLENLENYYYYYIRVPTLELSQNSRVFPDFFQSRFTKCKSDISQRLHGNISGNVKKINLRGHDGDRNNVLKQVW